MRLFWTKEAVLDLASIRSFIEADNTETARKVVLKILRQAESLLSHPYKGRAGRIQQTRESIVAGLPYLIIYRITDDSIEIIRALHTSRKYP